MLKAVWKKIKPLLPVLGEFAASPSVKQSAIDAEIRAVLQDAKARTPDSPVLKGFKVYSQVDEDGIIHNICARLGLNTGTFIELGCGKGVENNTHYMLLQGWKGVWVDGDAANIASICTMVPAKSPSLLVEQLFITKDNIAEAVQRWSSHLSGPCDLFSIDIDGNDAVILGEVAKIISPKVIVAEYNGKFPPPLVTTVAYNATHSWTGDDYYGASLQALVNCLPDHRLVCCNVAGTNAFFVRSDLSASFTNYSVGELFMTARNHLVQRKGAAPASLKYLREMLRDTPH